MRVLVISRRYPTRRHAARSPDNGPQLEALARHHDLRIIRPVAARPSIPPAVASLRPGRSRVAETAGLVCPTYSEPSGAWNARHAGAFDASVRAAVRLVARDFEPDIVLGSWDYPDGVTAVHIAGRLDVPVVLKAYASDESLGLQDRQRERILQVLRQADAVVAVSRAAARAVVSHRVARRSVHLVPDGVVRRVRAVRSAVDTRRRLGLPASRPLILCVVDESPASGLADLVRACAILRSRGIDAGCQIIGDEIDAGPVRTLIRSRGLDDRIVIGRPGPSVIDWIEASDVVVSPDFSDRGVHILRDAIEWDTPFVATRVGSVPEVAHSSYSRLVLAGAPGELAGALASVLTTPPKIDRSLIERVNITWEQSADMLSEQLQGALERRAAVRARRARAEGARQVRPALDAAHATRLDVGADVERLRAIARRPRR